MVSKARLDLPEPERPVMTVRLSRGISTSIPLRLCSRAPRTLICVNIRQAYVEEYESASDVFRSSFVLINASGHGRSTSLYLYGFGDAIKPVSKSPLPHSARRG